MSSFTELTPADYINAVRIYTNRYIVEEPTKYEVVLQYGDFEYALVWKYEDQCFFPRYGRKKTPEDDKMFRSVARHWRSMNRGSQASWLQDICQMLKIEYEEESEDDSSDTD